MVICVQNPARDTKKSKLIVTVIIQEAEYTYVWCGVGFEKCVGERERGGGVLFKLVLSFTACSHERGICCTKALSL